MKPATMTMDAIAATDPLALTGLPNDDVFFWSKRIDNSRVVRQTDTHVKGEWSAIAGVCGAAALVAGLMVAPGVAGIMDSYKIQDLKKEQAQLRNEKRTLDVDEEKLINAAQLNVLAGTHKLVRPTAKQVIRLQPRNSNSYAMNGIKSR